MAKYKVKVIETLEKIVEIEAENREEAFAIADGMWFNNEIEFDENLDYTDHEIYVISKQ